MRKAALAAHRAHAARAPSQGRTRGLTAAPRRRAHYSSGPVAVGIHCCMLQASKLRHRNAALREQRTLAQAKAPCHGSEL